MIKGTFLRFALSAAGAFGLTLAILTPIKLHADGPLTLESLFAPRPAIVGGVEFCMLYDGKPPEPGKAIVVDSNSPGELALRAINTTDKAVTIPVSVSMGSRTADPRSRVAPAEKEFYSQEQTIRLTPRETRMIAITPDKKLPLTSIVNVSVKADQKLVPGLSVTVGPIPEMTPRRLRGG